MKLLSVIVFVAFSSVHASHAAQLVIKEETGASLFVYLKEVGGSAKAQFPLKNYEEWDKGVARWKNLREGKYRLCLGPTHGSFANYCIVVSDLTISKGANNLSIRLPSYGTLDVEVKLQNVAPPRKPDIFHTYWFRVDRINKDGHCDPDYRQWLSTNLKDGIYTGSLSHMIPGTYRISAFHNDEYPKGSDLGCGLLVVTDEALEKKKTETIFIKAVEAGTGQPATRFESKLEGSEKPQPESEGRSR